MSPGVRWNEVTALFGGTFDPPHLGHREAVRGLFETPRVRAVRVLPSPVPPQKVGLAGLEDRMRMVKLGFAPSRIHPLPPEVEVDYRELERARTTSGQPTYTFDTLLEIRRELRDIAFVIGTDQLRNLPTWHRFPEILGLSHWIVLGRMPEGPDSARDALRDWVASGLLRPGSEKDCWTIHSPTHSPTNSKAGQTSLCIVPTRAPALSSTQIREQIARTGQPQPNSLLPEVEAYLKLHRIYGSRPPQEKL